MHIARLQTEVKFKYFEEREDSKMLSQVLLCLNLNTSLYACSPGNCLSIFFYISLLVRLLLITIDLCVIGRPIKNNIFIALLYCNRY